LPLEVLANCLGQEEIDHGLHLTLFFGRLPPYGDGDGNGLSAIAARATRLRLESRAISGGFAPVV